MVELESPLRPIECEVTCDALDEAEPYEVVVPYTTSELEFWSVVQVMVEVEVPGVPEEMLEMIGALVPELVVKVWSVEVEVLLLPSVDTTA